MTDAIDTVGVAAALAQAAATVADAADAAASAALPTDVRAVLLVGAGTAASAVELASASATCVVPTVVAEAPVLPGWCGPGALVCAVGINGDEADTIETATAAIGSGADVVVVAPAGSRLASLDGITALCPLDDATVPAIRHLPAAIAAATVLTRVAGAPPVAVDEIADAIAARADGFGSGADCAEHRERRHGRKLARTFPLVFGSAGAAGAAARHWSRAVNRSAKTTSFAAVHPACDHDVISAWGQAGDVTRQIFSIVELRHPTEPPSAAALFAASRGLLEEVVASTYEIRSDARDPFVAACDLAFAGDLVAASMAFESEVDPGPVEAVDRVFGLAGES